MNPMPAIMLCAGVALAATALHSRPAAADVFEDFGSGVCKAFGGCAPFGEYVPECVITQVRAFGTHARHHYEFERICNGVRAAKVSGAYDVGTGRASEKMSGLAGVQWSLKSSFTCTSDPWIFAGAAPACRNGTVQTQGQARQYEDYPITFPVSAGGLSDSERHVLDRQLANAIAMAEKLAQGQVGSGGLSVGDQVHDPLQKKKGGGALEVILAGQSADLTVASIGGPPALMAGLSGTFTVNVTNQGSVGATLELVIVFAGKLDQTGQIVAGAGLYCEVGRDAGINAALKCTGGRLEAGASANVIVQGRGQSGGGGMLIVTVNNSRAVTEASYDNNFKQLNVTIN